MPYLLDLIRIAVRLQRLKPLNKLLINGNSEKKIRKTGLL
jgi:hypothetical protein